MPDTIPVQAGPLISIPLFGDIRLDGVLRSEIEAHMTRSLSQYIREPVVRAQGLMRISLQGAVISPGFYLVPADMLLSEALMVAGGPASNAKLGTLKIERGPLVIMEGDALQEALREGLTLDQLDLQAGDQVLWPARGSGILTTLGLFGGVVTMISGIVVLIG
jgi:protein involved in polysaccharide export with SLBB domain